MPARRVVGRPSALATLPPGALTADGALPKLARAARAVAERGPAERGRPRARLLNRTHRAYMRHGGVLTHPGARGKPESAGR